MCGIAGVVSNRPIERMPAVADGFSRALQHRGPDDVGFLSWCGGGLSVGRDPRHLNPGTLVLVHRRLSIVDLSERGWQPMTDAAGEYAILLNGEIYNYPELRKEFEREGVEFRSQTDTEVLLQLLMRRGTAGLRAVVGMFAFAFLDTRRRTLWLGRDPFGIKPLFFSHHNGTIAFASEIRPLIELGYSAKTVEPSTLFKYLRHAVIDDTEKTAVVGIRQLLPAHTVAIDLEAATIGRQERYWRPTGERSASLTFEAAAEQLRARFADSVSIHLRADVPVAATLSGGIDSSAIVAMVARLRDVRDLAVFSYIAGEPGIDEEKYVDAVSAAVGIRPRKIRVTPEQLADDLDSLIVSQGQPFTTTSMWAQSRVFRRVHEDGFKVVLDGQGADELFAGYPVFRAARLAALVRRGRWAQFVTMLRSMPPPRGVILLQALGSLLPRPVREAARRAVGRPTMPGWLNGPWFGPQPDEPVSDVNGSRRSELSMQLYDATVASSLPMLLRYADRNAMAVSLENRVPFLTTALAEFAFSLPDEFLIGFDGTTKRLLRAAMRGVVPDVVLNRRDKIGFATPETSWFTESAALRARLRDALKAPLPACFAPSVSATLQSISSGTAPYGPEFWRCWNTVRWAQLLGLEFSA